MEIFILIHISKNYWNSICNVIHDDKFIWKKNKIESLNHLIVRDFWMAKIWLYFHKSIWITIFVCFSIYLSQKHMLLKVVDGALFIWTLWVFLLRLSNFKMTSVTLNTGFHIYLGRFVGDWTCIIQILE